jgi:hypothetical protein
MTTIVLKTIAAGPTFAADVGDTVQFTNDTVAAALVAAALAYAPTGATDKDGKPDTTIDAIN